MMDLLGADLPVEGGLPGEFAWADGPLLAALKAGDWVLLDELNLAGEGVSPQGGRLLMWLTAPAHALQAPRIFIAIPVCTIVV